MATQAKPMGDVARPALLSDVNELCAMMADDYKESGYPYYHEASVAAFRRLISDPALGRIWLLERDSVVAGYIVLAFCFSIEYGGRDAYVDDLYVRKPFRRSGLARLGLETLIDDCRRRSVRAISLEVEPKNVGAKRLYAKTGFGHNRRQLMTLRLLEVKKDSS